MAATLATALPETVPKRALATTAIFAGPPLAPPATLLAIFIMKSPVFVASRKAPKIINRMTKVAEIPRGTPNIPSR